MLRRCPASAYTARTVLRIRSEQIARFTALRKESFVKSAYQALQRHWSLQVARSGPDATLARLRTLVQSAFSLGFSTEPQVLRFINVCYALGDQFYEEHDWARRLLARRELTPEVRVRLLVEKTENWLYGEAVD